jgi:hypothetical protein
MRDRHMYIHVVGNKDDIAMAEQGMRSIFTWEDWDYSEDKSDSCSRNIKVYSLHGMEYFLCDKQVSTDDKLAELFEACPSLIFLVACSEKWGSFAGKVVYAYGRQVYSAEDNHLYLDDEPIELPDVFAPYLNAETRPTPEQIHAMYPEISDTERAERKTRMEGTRQFYADCPEKAEACAGRIAWVMLGKIAMR